MTIRHDGLRLDWLGYATARIESEDTVVYTDPGRYGTLDGTWAEEFGGADHPSGDAYDARDGDVVLVTHDHHYDSDGIRRVASEDATVLVYEAVDASNITGREAVPPEDLPYDVRRVGYGDEHDAGDVGVETIVAYVPEDSPGARAGVKHPRGFGCGFRFVVDGVSCFWTGDSGVIEEQEGVSASLLLPSIARHFTMNRHGAADLAETLDPDLVVPIHYNTFDMLRADSGAFAADVAKRGVPVALDERGMRSYSPSAGR
jgi:L-ascorbate metabolism protein UlaG (beta-lactamase superfamily)